jgi:hypothetical protein
MRKSRNSKTIQAFLLTSALGLGLISGAQAESTNKQPMSGMDASSFTKMDTNQDGVVSKAEADAAGVPVKSFSDMDLNHDGKISVEEYVKLAAPAASVPKAY